MTTPAFEKDLREALARRAAEVPASAGDSLRQRSYRPRIHSPMRAMAPVLGAAVIAASAGAYLAGAVPGGGPAVSPGPGTSIVLDGHRLTLPPGFKRSHRHCVAPRRGLPGVPVPASARFAAGATAHGGCVEALFTSVRVDPPASASRIRVDGDQGYLVAPRQQRRVALYVKLPGTGHYGWLVIAAYDLPSRDVVSMGDRTLRGER